MSEPIIQHLTYSYATKDDIRRPGWSMLTRRGSFHRVTLGDLLDWCREIGQDPTAIEVSAGHVSYIDSETEQERDDRLERLARSDARHAEWERSTYERLRDKFDSLRVGTPEGTKE